MKRRLYPRSDTPGYGSAGASQEGRPQAGTVDADISTIAEPDAEPAATAESEPAAEPDKKPAGRKPRRKADEG